VRPVRNRPARTAIPRILVADPDVFDGGGAVFRVDPATGVQTTVSANGIPPGGPTFNNPRGMAVEPDDDIIVIDSTGFGGTVIRVDPVTGACTTVSANGSPAGGPSFANPVGVAIEADGDILVADTSAFSDSGGGVIRIDPATGARTTVSANSSPTGDPSFRDPQGVAVEADGDIPRCRHERPLRARRCRDPGRSRDGRPHVGVRKRKPCGRPQLRRPGAAGRRGGRRHPGRRI
jgi:hypothetical protein